MSIIGSRVGSNADDEGGTGSTSWSVDTLGGKAVPANSTEWSALIASKGLGMSNPNSLWLAQEAAGNLSDSIGALTLTAANTPGYQTAVPGWSRLGVSTVDAGTAKFAAAAATGPNPTTTSSLWVWYVTSTVTPAATRTILSVGGALATTSGSAQIKSLPAYRSLCVNVIVDGASNPTAQGVMPVAVLYDRTNSRFVVYTGQDKIVGTYSAGVTDGAKGIGATLGTAATASYLYGFMYSGAAAELTDAQVKALLVGLGWTIPWT